MHLPDDVRALLRAPNIAHLATLLPDGAPHAVPVWIGVEGERIAFLTSPGSRKARNVGRDPRVAISLTDHARPNVMAHVRGRVAEVLEGAAAWTVIDRLANAYLGQDYPLREDRAVYLVEPERAWALAF